MVERRGEVMKSLLIRDIISKYSLSLILDKNIDYEVARPTIEKTKEELEELERLAKIGEAVEYFENKAIYITKNDGIYHYDGFMYFSREDYAGSYPIRESTLETPDYLEFDTVDELLEAYRKEVK